MIYIRRIQMDDAGPSEPRITAVQYSFSTTGALRSATKEQVVAAIDAGHEYRIHNDNTGVQAPVVTGVSVDGLPDITAVVDGRETGHLLALPRF